jgi:hypothetical protein
MEETIDWTIEKSKQHKGHCSFVQITPEEHDELLSDRTLQSDMEVLKASEVSYRPPPPGFGI